jgi:hypothetical protein
MTEPLDRTIDDARFEELLGADPFNQDPAFLAAARATPERHTAWQAAREVETRLRAALHAVTPPEGLAEQLLGIPDQAPRVPPFPRVVTHGGDWLRRLLPVAAVLLLALGINRHFQLDDAMTLQRDLFGHIYGEAPFITSRQVLLDELNSSLEATVGAHLVANASTEKLDVTFIRACRVAKRRSAHLVVKGEQGEVTVLMLNEPLVSAATPIADARLSGRIVPSGGKHTLVVVGDGKEPIDAYLDVIDSNLEWEY